MDEAAKARQEATLDQVDQNWRDEVREDERVKRTKLEEWKHYMRGQLHERDLREVQSNALHTLRMDALQKKLDQVELKLDQVDASTAGIVAMMISWDGAMKVIEAVGKVLKPITIIVGFCTALVAFYYGVKHNIKGD